MPRVFESGFQPDGSYITNPYFMQRAFYEAGLCIQNEDHPVGAVVVGPRQSHGIGLDLETIVGIGNNQVHLTGFPTAHAETVAIDQAIKNVTPFELSRCVLVTSHVGCPQCSGAVFNAKLAGVVFSTSIEDVENLIATNEKIKWRSNGVHMHEILHGETPVLDTPKYKPFISGGFMREQGIKLLERTAELTF